MAELMLHVEELLNKEVVDYLMKEDVEIEENDHELKFKRTIERHFIDSRSIALENIRKGLTLNGMMMC
jgi:hypothetical protein